MKRFEYFEPSRLPRRRRCSRAMEAALSRSRAAPTCWSSLREQLRRADCVVNIKKIPGIGALSFDPQAGLRIGALVTARALEVSEVIREKYPSLLQAVRELGSIQVRNRATIVGNVCRYRPRPTRCRR